MKRFLFIQSAFIIALSGCTSYFTTDSLDDQNYPEVYCENLEYLATMNIGPETITYATNNHDGTTRTSTKLANIAEEELLHYNLLKTARAKFGEDVMIVNVKWDKLATSRKTRLIGVTFDVVKCE